MIKTLFKQIHFLVFLGSTVGFFIIWFENSSPRFAYSQQVANLPDQACYDRPGYPLGRWETTVNSETNTKFATFITFTRPKGGTWLPSTGQGNFTTSVVPAPRRQVILRLRTETGNYLSTNKLVVSSDGCSMQGTFSDSGGVRGEVKYTWEGE
ncbi:hypothetical protein OsccyDRAFT_2852 [Leptolyngbyaceae cyanobacterium JSC-12]|nr:hypothetical protein OsccyDRAFT_2852 [Leptolyngbyaceae cyanobacterium JSC-12]